MRGQPEGFMWAQSEGVMTPFLLPHWMTEGLESAAASSIHGQNR